jgi:DNA-binding beta-propeller fold protein YncE
MANAMGGGGGVDGFRHLLEHLGPASQKWLADMRDHAFLWDGNSLDNLTKSVEEELKGKDVVSLERQRDQLLAEIIQLKQKSLIQSKLDLNTSGKAHIVPPGSSTHVLLLNIGLAEPLKGKSPNQVMHSGQILSVAAEQSGQPSVLAEGLYNPDGIDVAISTKRMYWTQMGTPNANDGSILSANLDGSDIQEVVKSGDIHTPKQIVIDQTNNKIYVCDREGLQVFRCNLDGTQLEVLYQSGDWKIEPDKMKDPTLWPVGITVSSKMNKFFWTQKGGSKAGQGRIFSAGLDLPADESPSNRSDIELVLGGLPECIDLEIDDEEGILYWTDRGELPLGNTLNKKHLVGEVGPEEKALGRLIIAQGLGEGIGLRLDKAKSCLYVADMTGHLWKCSTEYGLKEKMLEAPSHAYTGVAFYKE